MCVCRERAFNVVVVFFAVVELRTSPLSQASMLS